MGVVLETDKEEDSRLGETGFRGEWGILKENVPG